MRPRYLISVLTLSLLGLLLHLESFAQNEKHEIVPGSDFQHPIYLPLEEGKQQSRIQGIGDNSKRPAIVYVVRLEAGQQLSAKLASTSELSRGQQPFALYLFDSKTTSLVGSGTTWILRQPGNPESKAKTSLFGASFEFAAPVTDDYYIVPTFQSAGLLFTLVAKVTRVANLPRNLSCVTGQLTKPTFVAPGASNSVISDVTVGDRAKADHPDDHNRHFCIVQACEIRPPTSLVLTVKLQNAFEAKTNVKVCWDPSNTVTEVSVMP